MIIPGNQNSEIPLPTPVPGATVGILSSGSGLSGVTLVDGNVTYKPAPSFSGKSSVTLATTLNGVTTTQTYTVIVLPVAPTEGVSAPILFTTSTVSWAPSPNAIGYKVLIRGVQVCATTTTNCQVPFTVGPGTPVTVEALGHECVVIKSKYGLILDQHQVLDHHVRNVVPDNDSVIKHFNRHLRLDLHSGFP